MATLAGDAPAEGASDAGFFMRAAIAMAMIVVAGFSLQLAMGRSTFASPPLVHAHAIVFMGWVTIYLLQNAFVAGDAMPLHRRLGWIGAGWVVAMVVLGCWVTVAMVRRGHVPFIFQPLQFLVFDPMTVFTFAGLTAAAIAMRRRTDWHRRLHYCGMSLLLGPAFGRLLPMPFLVPWAFEATFAALMIFPLVGMVRDARRSGRVHPAWRWGVAAMVGSILLTEAIAYSPLGSAIYRRVTAGSPGAAVDPLAFPPPPPGMLITGRPAGE
ncbi:MAG TPA: hypothetical protein VHM92_10995 [Allosphingosinicella sp.]|nr:hypothetical protein [Allosphingosinicella sp.]